jgi:hypothetical protein
MLYKRWYCDSFRRAIKNNLNPIKEIKNGETIEDADNVLKHILARLFEFLYISVYRETTFMEIFNNADPNVFLEAVGITKKDFEVLNKYKVFQEDVLNNYIHDFFINESLGLKIDSQSKEAISQYRNSFDWFEFGLESNEQIDNNENIVNSNITTDNGNSKDEEKIIDNQVLLKENQNSSEDKTDSETNQLEERIRDLLKKHKTLKINKISNLLNVPKDEINKVLNLNKNLFYKDLFFNWRLK